MGYLHQAALLTDNMLDTNERDLWKLGAITEITQYNEEGT